jgi:tRNA dimethylallyltransferase
MPKVIAIVGPTAVGKSNAAIELALQLPKFCGSQAEIISADSRQVYRGLDLGTGKVTPEEMKGVPHHMLDVAFPCDVYTASDFAVDGRKVISEILDRGNIPIICGGSGFYIDSLFGLASIPDIPRDLELRAKLETKTTEELYQDIILRDPARASTIDKYNRPRLIRALEIIEALGAVPPANPSPLYDVFYIGLELPLDQLQQNISLRLKKRMDDGMLDEIRSLHEQGLPYERMEDLGLEYRYGARLLQEQITLQEFYAELELKIFGFAKRQLTWFRKNKSTHWIDARDEKAFEAVLGETVTFLKN